MWRRRSAAVFVAAFAGCSIVGAPGAAPPVLRVLHADKLSFPTAIVGAFGSVWVGEHRGNFVLRVNPRTARITKRFLVPENLCGDFAVAAGRLWLGNCAGETGYAKTYELDPRTGRIDGTIQGSQFPAFAGGSIWTATFPQGVLIRSDPRTRVRLATVHLPFPADPNGQTPGTLGYGSLWATNGSDAAARIDLRTNAVTLIPLPGGFYRIDGYYDSHGPVFAAGRAWLPNGAGLYEIDPNANKVTLHRMRIGPFSEWGDVGIAAHGTDIYIRVSNTRVVRIDARTGKVRKSYPADGGGGEVAAAYGSLWWTNASTDTIRRGHL
jgi:streptogramin lyase